MSLVDLGSNPATIILAGANTINGTARMISHTSSSTLVRLTNSNALQNLTLDYNNYGAAFTFGTATDNATTSFNFGGLKGAQNINLRTADGTKAVTLTVGSNGGNTIYSGVLSSNSTGGGSLVKTGSGTLTLSGANTYNGTTTINGGILSVSALANGGSNSSIGASGNASTNLVINGGTLQYSGAGNSTDRLFSVGTSNATLDASGTGTPLNFTNTGAIGFNSQTGARMLTLTGNNTGANTLSAILGDNSGATSLTKSGAGTWTLTGTSAYTGGTIISNGILQLSGSGTLGSTSGSLTVNNGGTLDLNNLSQGVGALSGTAGGLITNVTGNAAAKTLTVGNGNATGGNYAGAISNSGNGNGTLALTKVGTGIQTLSGANTYTGNTTVSAGTLLINGSTSTTSAVNVSNAATLGGNGTVGGNTVLAAGSKLSPGDNSAEAIHFTNGLDISAAANGSSAFVFSLGTSSDKVVVGGTLTLGTNLLSAADFSFTAGAGFAPNTNYTLFQSLAVSGSFNSFSVTNIGGSGLDGTVSLSSNNIVLATVPEPATWALLAFSLTTVMVLRRRKTY